MRGFWWEEVFAAACLLLLLVLALAARITRDDVCAGFASGEEVSREETSKTNGRAPMRSQSGRRVVPIGDPSPPN